MQPKFVDLPEKKVVGLGTKFISILSKDKNNMNVIPALWDQFIKQVDRIGHRTNQNALGVVEMLGAGENRTHDHEMFYIAAAEVSDFEMAPAGMIQRLIPAGRYALFTHKGKLNGLERTMQDIHRDWLPASGLAMRKAPELEIYDERFNPGSDASEFDILIPVT